MKEKRHGGGRAPVYGGEKTEALVGRVPLALAKALREESSRLGLPVSRLVADAIMKHHGHLLQEEGKTPSLPPEEMSR